ncbi:MAG: glucose-6-phosphate isomerase [Planctomycetota bacterium]|nr:glucose-6-phosphate isomerase [Planctomycetota bacterium]
MSMSLWDRFNHSYCGCPSIELSLDISRIDFDSGFMAEMEPRMQQAFKEMDALEAGAVANPDEDRMVGHYWLRAPELSPTPEIGTEIRETINRIQTFANDIHTGRIQTPEGRKFSHVLSIGIGGSALGPMFVSDALSTTDAKMGISFIDNTDPGGIARTLARLGDQLAETLVIVITKSGGTPDTRNGMALVRQAYLEKGLEFSGYAVAVTMQGSKMDQLAESEQWIARFPMFDWIGGRTSELSAVGLLPAALEGLDIEAMLGGAAACDVVTRNKTTAKNPAALLALMWYSATDGRGLKDMVVLPYKDQLLLLSRYLQQLVMESLGKRLDRDGNRVDQGIAVYGNKGSTDQHAFVQQLRDGINNFFVTFIRVLEFEADLVEVEPGITAGDYLHGFLVGTRAALAGNDRQSLTLSVARVDARTVGVLIALFERAVGFYGSLININAYHQPGVEAGKKAAASVLELQTQIIGKLSDKPQTAQAIADAINAQAEVETVYLLCEHLVANGRADCTHGVSPAETVFISK